MGQWYFRSSTFVLDPLAGTVAQAEPSGKIPRIGYLSGTGDASNQGPYVAALRQGLRDLGYIEGKNYAIEFRGAGGKSEPVTGLVAELIQLKVDVLVLPLFVSDPRRKAGDPKQSRL